MSIPSTLASSACPTLPSPPRVSAGAPVRLLGARLVWRVLWEGGRPARRGRRTAPQVDLRGRLE
ncbi:MAG TPA: hypothetical protein VD764_02360 [Nocardioides sp.]|nr:hypothetical protein [Nocardioides sp.]